VFLEVGLRAIRIVAADDSSAMRHLLTRMFALERTYAPVAMELCAAVPDGASCLHAVRTLQPDVVLLDLHMPGLGGMEAIGRLRREWPRLPIIMCSAATEDGAAATMEALACGASDYVTKPMGCADAESAMVNLYAQLAPRIIALVMPGVSLRRCGEVYADARAMPRARIEVVGIGVSTGGPAALERLLPRLPEDFPAPVLVVQHMPKLFTSALATRLDRCCAMRVKQATAGAALRPGTIWIAPGESHLEVKMGMREMPYLVLTQGERVHGCRPAVDVLFRSLAATFGAAAAGMVLTGMGSDGLEGSAAIVDAGGVVMAQDEASSAVWGMPGRVVSAGLAERVLPLEGLAEELIALTESVERREMLPLRREVCCGAC
jgi:two-component system chemotaxis response regulator CheB